MKMFTLLFCLEILLFCQGQGTSLPSWVPRLGTLAYPKNLANGLNNSVRYGDVFEVNGALFMSKTAGRIVVNVSDSSLWLKLDHGSFLNPIVSGNSVVSIASGDIVYDNASSTYYIYNGSRTTIDSGWKAIANFSVLNYKADWMKLMRPIIGDRRFGDLVIPGSHDSATYAISKDSMIIDYVPLYVVAFKYGLSQLIANWSKAQNMSLGAQLALGFRNLDLRIADNKNEFYWWHGITSATIYEGLQEIQHFSMMHSQEVLYLKFQHITAAGNSAQIETPMNVTRKQQLAAIILHYLGDRLVNKTGLSNNPTINEILNTGGNIIAHMEDDYIRSLNTSLFWPIVSYADYRAESNTEDLFNDRSYLLSTIRSNYTNSITDVSGCVTPNTNTTYAGLLLHLQGQTQTEQQQAFTIIPALKTMQPSQMSFEGLYSDLLTMAAQGTNTLGMRARPSQNYTNGASVHYSGVNDMLPYWLARPQRYKVNIVYVDDVDTSTIVDTAISANAGQIPRQVTIAHQGSTRDGFLQWHGDQTAGGADGLSCITVRARYRLASSTYVLAPPDDDWRQLSAYKVATFSEGQYPPDATVTLQVSTANTDNWVDLFSENVQDLISDARDLYVRGADEGEGRGFAYVSEMYNAFGDNCTSYPQSSSDYVALRILSPASSSTAATAVSMHSQTSSVTGVTSPGPTAAAERRSGKILVVYAIVLYFTFLFNIVS